MLAWVCDWALDGPTDRPKDSHSIIEARTRLQLKSHNRMSLFTDFASSFFLFWWVNCSTFVIMWSWQWRLLEFLTVLFAVFAFRNLQRIWVTRWLFSQSNLSSAQKITSYEWALSRTKFTTVSRFVTYEMSGLLRNGTNVTDHLCISSLMANYYR